MFFLLNGELIQSTNYIFLPFFYIKFMFCLGDMLGGHLDDMEADWSKPIVSMRYVAVPFNSCILVVVDCQENRKQDRVNTSLSAYLSLFFTV